MNESLNSRVGRMIAGGAHRLVEALENAAPEVVLEQSIREVEGLIDDVRAELGAVAAQRHLAGTRLMAENRRHEELGEQVEVALREGREDLAEAAVGRQLDIEAQIPVLEATITGCSEKSRELENMVAALQGRKREMVEDLREFRARDSGTGTGGVEEAGSDREREKRLEAAQEAFDRVVENASGVPGRGLPAEAAKLAELEALARKNRIRERLAEARSRSQSGE